MHRKIAPFEKLPVRPDLKVKSLFADRKRERDLRFKAALDDYKRRVGDRLWNCFLPTQSQPLNGLNNAPNPYSEMRSGLGSNQ